MAFTDVWDAPFNLAPADNAQVSGGDDAIRQLKVAVYERLAAILTDLNVDPPTIKLSVLGTIGAQTDRIMAFGPHTLEAVNDEDDTDHQSAYIGMNTSGLTLNGSIYVPDGITIQRVQASMDRQNAASCSMELFKHNLTTGVKTTLDTVVRGVAGIGVSDGAIANPPGIGDVVDSDNYVYGVRFFAAGWIVSGPRFYGLKLFVDVPGVEAAV